jgi:hypothetical protein
LKINRTDVIKRNKILILTLMMLYVKVIANTRSSLEVLGLTGNRLGGKGLSGICKGLIVNTKLKTIYLADNMIDQVSKLIPDYVMIQTMIPIMLIMTEIING